MLKKTLIFLLLSLCCVGCFSTKKPSTVSITAAYPFEGRYSAADEITINGIETKVKDSDSLWVLSNNTLYNLLVSVSDSKDKILFGTKEKTYFLPSEKNNRPIESRDAFDDEEYVWDNWTVPTNGVR